MTRKTAGLDQFYTPQSTADWVLQVLHDQPWFLDLTAAIEPTAGRGAFIEALRPHGHLAVHAYDLEPAHPDVLRQDALRVDVRAALFHPEQGAVIPLAHTLLLGNPPYGLHHGAASDIWEHFAPHVGYSAFIVPRSMALPKYMSRAKAVPACHDVLFCLSLPSDKFDLPDGTRHPVPGLALVVTRHRGLRDPAPNPRVQRGEAWRTGGGAPCWFSRRTEALLRADLVLVRFGGRSGQLAEAAEVTQFVQACKTLGQNRYLGLFFGTPRAREVVTAALQHDLSMLLEANTGALAISPARLQRLAEARICWGR